MPKEVFRTTERSTKSYVDGTEIAYSMKISDKRLARLIWRAAKNKGRKAIAGPVQVEAKVLQKGTEFPNVG